MRGRRIPKIPSTVSTSVDGPGVPSSGKARGIIPPKIRELKLRIPQKTNNGEIKFHEYEIAFKLKIQGE